MAFAFRTSRNEILRLLRCQSASAKPVSFSTSSQQLAVSAHSAEPKDSENSLQSSQNNSSLNTSPTLLCQDDLFDLKSLVKVEELFKARCHLGHNEGLRDPSMSPFLLGCRRGTDIIDLDQTVPLLHQALDVTAHIAHRGGMILFLSRHLQTLPWVEKTAKEIGEYAHCRPWRRGIFTNASSMFGTLPVLPDLCVFLHTQDSVFEPHRAIVESAKLLVPSIGVCDSNTDPNPLTYAVPGNDDTPDAVMLYLRLFKEAVVRGKAKRKEDGLAQ